jgi:hypothetical protein
MYQNSNVVFHSSTSNLEAMMDACFPRQHKAHVEAYRAYQEKLTRAARNAAIFDGLKVEPKQPLMGYVR